MIDICKKTQCNCTVFFYLPLFILPSPLDYGHGMPCPYRGVLFVAYNDYCLNLSCRICIFSIIWLKVGLLVP